MDFIITSDKPVTILKSINDNNNMELTQNKLISPVNSIHDEEKRNQVKKFICVELGVIYAERNF